MNVEQFVMAYGVEQDRIRAMLPEGNESLRPVLRINTEIRDETDVYVELNTPIESGEMRGWLNIGHWDSETGDLSFERKEKTVVIRAPFLHLSYTGVGIEGSCPAEKDNDGCVYLDGTGFRAAETIRANKEFCDCTFQWAFHPGDAQGMSIGKTIPAFYEEPLCAYQRVELTPENAAAIPCRQVLGSYIVRFQR